MQVQPHPQPQPRPQPTPTLTLRGTLLILNISYEKRVSIRFTLDDWLTASEVGVSYCRAGVLPVEWAHCVGDGACLPSFFFMLMPVLAPMLISRLMLFTSTHPADPAYDTLTFTISL
ncbi:carbohydrate-binding module family 21 protein [Ramaria rubella]|nr:carbohydrate-binding module family 21 protein [Ramaria rubella]